MFGRLESSERKRDDKVKWGNGDSPVLRCIRKHVMSISQKANLNLILKTRRQSAKKNITKSTHWGSQFISDNLFVEFF